MDDFNGLDELFEYAARLNEENRRDEARSDIDDTDLTAELEHQAAWSCIHIDLDPANLAAYRTLAVALAGLGDRQAAIGVVQVGLRWRDRLLDGPNAKGLELQSEGRFEAAKPYFREAYEAVPEFVWLYLHLARLLRDFGALPEAARAFEEVLVLDPGSEEAKHALRELRVTGTPLQHERMQ